MKTCIHTVILNELDEYLKVWLDHHTNLVDHIFIFEDIDSHSHKHITNQYPNVTLWSVFDIYDEDWRKEKLRTHREKGGINQRFYIMDGVLKIQALKTYDWCLCADIDEFLTFQPPYTSVCEVLEEFNDYVAVMIQWKNYGANGHIYKPNYEGRDYREFYTKEGEFNKCDANFKITTKLFFNLRQITRWNLCGLHCTAGNWVNTKFKKDRKEICYDKLYLKHYVTRSFEEWLWKLAVRGNHCGSSHRKIEQFFEIEPSMMDKYDECMKFKEEYFKKHNITYS